MRRVVVEESFSVNGRGAAVFCGSAEGLPLGRPLRVRVERPDGSTLSATATVELALRRRPQPVERAALLVAGVTREDVPPYSVLFIEE